MPIESHDDWKGLRAAAQGARLDALERAVRPGVTTGELDALAARSPAARAPIWRSGVRATRRLWLAER
jgi:hypothetical protein